MFWFKKRHPEINICLVEGLKVFRTRGLINQTCHTLGTSSCHRGSALQTLNLVFEEEEEEEGGWDLVRELEVLSRHTER